MPKLSGALGDCDFVALLMTTRTQHVFDALYLRNKLMFGLSALVRMRSRQRTHSCPLRLCSDAVVRGCFAHVVPGDIAHSVQLQGALISLIRLSSGRSYSQVSCCFASLDPSRHEVLVSRSGLGLDEGRLC